MHPGDKPRRKKNLQIAPLLDGRILVRHQGGHTLRAQVDPKDLETLLTAVDGKRTAAEIATLLSDRFDAGDVLQVLANLTGDVLEIVPTGSSPPPCPHVLVAGAGLVAEAITAWLENLRLARVKHWVPGPLESQEFASFNKRRQLSFPGLVAKGLVAGNDLVVCAMEGQPGAYPLALQQACLAAGVPFVFTEQSAGKARIGPTVIPGSACLACSWLHHLRTLDLPAADLLTGLAGLRSEPFGNSDMVVALLRREIGAVLAGEASLLQRVLTVEQDGTRRDIHLQRLNTCLLCGDQTKAIKTPRVNSLAAAAERTTVIREDRRPRFAMARQQGTVRHIGILGGGTAGYLTALALRAKHPHLEVTLIESSKVPVIGVGEATTPLMPQFLHVDLGLDMKAFFAAVKPTLKLGIRFLWGEPGEGWFNYPFGPNQVLESLVYEGRLTDACLQSMMMDAGVLPLSRQGETYHCDLDTEVAYHLDNRRFVNYLKDQAENRGVHLLDREIVRVRTNPSGENIEALVCAEGSVHEFDFYVDCSGFRSLLLDHALGSEFVAYDKSLFTDRALIACVPNQGVIQPYTLAETMTAGWCWNTPQPQEDHRGYVFSSAWLNPEEAEREMRAKNPGMAAAKLIKFRAGRHRHFWRGNLVAMGNAYGFVEPLESTALHLLIRQIGLFVRAFPITGNDPGVAAIMNRKVNGWWDYLVWFLAIHYKFNRKLDTPFWQACRHDVDVTAYGELIETFRRRGPLAADATARAAFDYPDPLWGAAGIDVILAGQATHQYLPQPAMSARAWRKLRERAQHWVGRNLPQRQALDLLTSNPELLDRFAARFQAVGSAF